MDYLNIAIAAAYFSISILLVPLLENAYKDVKITLYLFIAFITSCAIGHSLEGFGYHYNSWHLVTAIISWMAAAVLLVSRSRLKFLSQSFKLLDTSWDESLSNKILFQRTENDDLEIIRISDNFNDKKMRAGKLFSETDFSNQVVFPQNKKVIDMYIGTGVTEAEKVEFSYKDKNGITNWFLVVCAPISDRMIYVASLNLSELSSRAIVLGSENHTIGIILETNLKLEDELSLVYQPIVKLATGEIVGAEALLRWNSPPLGNISPDKFIPIAEDNGLIIKLTSWVLREAVEQLSKWKEYNKDFSLSVNISAIELEEEEFLNKVLNLILEFGITGKSLSFEVTERKIYKNLAKYSSTLRSLELMNIVVKVDDFGKGISGLSNLLQGTFKELKLDKSLVPSNIDDFEKMSVCRAIASIASDLNLNLVGEGIETEAQWKILLDMGYQFGQGYYFARPMPPEEFTKLLAEGFHYKIN